MSHDYITLMWLPTRSFLFAANTPSLDTASENKTSILEHFEILTFEQRDLCSLAVSRQSSKQEPLQRAERKRMSAKCFSRSLQRQDLTCSTLGLLRFSGSNMLPWPIYLSSHVACTCKFEVQSIQGLSSHSPFGLSFVLDLYLAFEIWLQKWKDRFWVLADVNPECWQGGFSGIWDNSILDSLIKYVGFRVWKKYRLLISKLALAPNCPWALGVHRGVLSGVRQYTSVQVLSILISFKLDSFALTGFQSSMWNMTIGAVWIHPDTIWYIPEKKKSDLLSTSNLR